MQKDLSYKDIEDYSKKLLKKHLCFKCKKCTGTGLKDFKPGSYWNGSFCDYCEGVGLFYLNELIKKGLDINKFYCLEDEKEEN